MALQPYSRRGTETGEAVNEGQQPQSHRVRRAPTWFSEPSSPTARDDAAERYRAMRGEVLRRREGPEGGRPFLLDLEIKRSFGLEGEARAELLHQERAPMAPPRRVIAARPVEENEQHSAPVNRPHRKLHRKVKAQPMPAARGYLPLKYIAAGLAAVMTGGLLGYVATHYKAIGAKADEIAGLIRPGERAAETDSLTIVAK